MARPRCWTAPMPTRKSNWVGFISSTCPIWMPRFRGRRAAQPHCTVSWRCAQLWTRRWRRSVRIWCNMRNLIVFNHVTLDGYFVSANGDMNWARTGNDDAEYSAFVAENASGGGQLLFGRVTYDLMASYWPPPVADQHPPPLPPAI